MTTPIPIEIPAINMRFDLRKLNNRSLQGWKRHLTLDIKSTNIGNLFYTVHSFKDDLPLSSIRTHTLVEHPQRSRSPQSLCLPRNTWTERYRKWRHCNKQMLWGVKGRGVHLLLNMYHQRSSWFSFVIVFSWIGQNFWDFGVKLKTKQNKKRYTETDAAFFFWRQHVFISYCIFR